ncbi:hypothetical protein H1R20_g4974, partial [Candolleomyces eurysporus]
MESREDPNTTAMLETKLTVWPTTVKDIDKLIKHAEKLVNDLAIDLAAAQTKGSESDIVDVTRKQAEEVSQEATPHGIGATGKKDSLLNHPGFNGALRRPYCRKEDPENAIFCSQG